MGRLVLQNRTGKRRGNYLHYNWGQDLFGYLYLDVIRQHKHLSRLVKRSIFDNPRDFVCTLDIELYNKENLHYEPLFSGGLENKAQGRPKK